MSLRTPFFPSERWQLKTIIGCGTLDSVSRSNNKATKRTQKRNYFVLCYVLFDEGVFTRIHVKSHISHHSIKLANSSYSSYKIQYMRLWGASKQKKKFTHETAGENTQIKYSDVNISHQFLMSALILFTQTHS